MCMAIPMRVLSVSGGMARVGSAGVELPVALDLVEGVSPGDYVIVHAGWAIQRLDREEAEETLEMVRRLEESWER